MNNDDLAALEQKGGNYFSIQIDNFDPVNISSTLSSQI